MNLSNPVNIVKAAVGVGGSLFAAPVAMPVLHGLAGVALVGAGLIAAGSLVAKTAGVINGHGAPLIRKRVSNNTVAEGE